MTHRYPEQLVVDLAALLRHHHATELFPLILGLTGDQILPERRDDHTTPGILDTNTIRALIHITDRTGNPSLLTDVVELLGPWLPTASRRAVTLAELPAPRVDAPLVAAAITTNELEVLVGLANGLTIAEIGAALFLSHDAVKSRITKLRKRLGAKNGAHAVRIAIQRGLLPLPGNDDRGAA